MRGHFGFVLWNSVDIHEDMTFGDGGLVSSDADVDAARTMAQTGKLGLPKQTGSQQ